MNFSKVEIMKPNNATFIMCKCTHKNIFLYIDNKKKRLMSLFRVEVVSGLCRQASSVRQS